MAKIEGIPTMTLEELRPFIQRALGLEEWPVSDWIVVGMIFDHTGIQINRAAFPAYPFTVVVTGKEIGSGIGSGVDPDPVTAIFRAYLTWRSYQAKGK